MKQSSKKVWQTSSTDALHPLVERYTVGIDYQLDQRLIPYDVQASRAHMHMLHTMGILNAAEVTSLEDGFTKLLATWEQGTFLVQPAQEDGHTAIEQFLCEICGEVGKKIHTGRSRNDQSLVMMRLYMKDALSSIDATLQDVTDALRRQAAKHTTVPMPGYTHMQRAMPTTVGTWFASYADALSDVRILLQSVVQVIDQNPLGSASGFGIQNFPIDRGVTTKELRFAKTQENPLYCGFSRGHFEQMVAHITAQVMLVLGRFANDMILFTMQEFRFFSLPPSFTTGSSIMPQKRNYDVFEIMQGNAKLCFGYQSQIYTIMASLGSGYHRDLQLTKQPCIAALDVCEESCRVLHAVVDAIVVHEAELSGAMTPDLFVTNEVYDRVNKGETFRDAYQAVKEKWHQT